ncbi:MAG: hypothetical protein R6W96_03385 [Clostridia bacterium]
MIYEYLGNLEVVIMGFLMLSLLVFFTLMLIIFFLSYRERRNFKPVLRTEGSPEELMCALEHVRGNFEAYVKNICYLQESRNQSPDLMSQKYIGMLCLKNYGNSPALDIDVTGLASYMVSDGPEKKLFSLNPGDSKVLLFYMPPDTLATMSVNKLRFKYKNCLRESFRDRILITNSTGIGCKLDNLATVMALVQT